jgi:aspartate aminotransferase/aminotransferase
MRPFLADRTQVIDASGIRKVFALAAQLKDPVNFSIGQPDFDVPETIKRAAIRAIEAGFNRYSQTAGEQKLIDAIKAKVAAGYGWQNPQCFVTSGVSGGLQLAFMATINPGDEVIVPDPYFVMYKHLVNMLGGKCVFIDTYPDFRLPVEKIEKAITPKTKLLILNSPANPSGVVYTRAEVQAVAEIARKHGILVLSDEIYEDFCYDGPCDSVARYYDGTLVLKGYSKTYAMTGWRMGYAAATEVLKPLMDKMIQIQQYTFVCAPTPFQVASIEAMSVDMTEYVNAYRKKRDRMIEGLSKGYEVVKSGGAFYLFVKVPPKYPNATVFVQKAIENNVLVIPGNVFSERDTHFRISYATTDAKIEQGIDILNRLSQG